MKHVTETKETGFNSKLVRLKVVVREWIDAAHEMMSFNSKLVRLKDLIYL